MKQNSISVAHLTSAHSRYDTRIFLKECSSLASRGFDVSLVVADGLPSETRNGVHILGVDSGSSRLSRMLFSSWRVYRKALECDADIYHLHDPELLPYALLLTLKGRKVIFDAHEDFPKQLQAKEYLSPTMRRVLSGFFSWFERFLAKRISAIVAATPTIERKFSGSARNVTSICNYPILGELEESRPGEFANRKWVAYIGGISKARGIVELVQAMDIAEGTARLKLCGSFSGEALRRECRMMPGWSKVDELGFVGREEVREVLSGALAGIVTLHATPNHLESLPIKMFEYMSAGVPVVASHFPLWREIIEDSQCGTCVDPERPEQIAQAIDWLASHPEEAERMGQNGQHSVHKKYNWAIEEEKLFSLYQRVLEETE